MARMKHTVSTWQEARDAHRRFARRPKHGGEPRVPLGYATWLNKYQPEGVPDESAEYAVRFHATDVVTYHPDGMLTVRTGGWFTKTTTERIEKFTPSDVFVDHVGIYRPPPKRYSLGLRDEYGVVWFDLMAEESVRIRPQVNPG